MKILLFLTVCYVLFSCIYLAYCLCENKNENEYLINSITGFLLGFSLILSLLLEQVNVAVVISLSIITGILFGIVFMYVLSSKKRMFKEKIYTIEKLINSTGTVIEKVSGDNCYLCELDDECKSEIIIYFTEEVKIDNKFQIIAFSEGKIIGKII